LKVAYETIDDVAGLPSRYTAKLLAHAPMRTLGRVSLGPTLQCLGMTLVAVEDLSALKRIESRLSKRRRSPQDAGCDMLAAKVRKRHRFPRGSDHARIMRARQILQQSPADRSAIARKAARARVARACSPVMPSTNTLRAALSDCDRPNVR